MEIKGKVHCFFEQSGTFKNEFKKLGIPAEDYDIQNNFGETDHVVDLFGAIETAYSRGKSLFDIVLSDDLIFAFFPCIYFCENSQLAMTYSHGNYKKLSLKQKTDEIIKRSKNRQYFYELLLKLFAIVYDRGLRMIVENPYSPHHYLQLTQNFVSKPTIIDKDRTKRGDFFKKPTAYWFVNCENTNGFTHQQTPLSKVKNIAHAKSGVRAGICSEERSVISPDYARNFICDFVIGKHQQHIDPTLFDSIIE